MTSFVALVLPLALGAVIEVPAGANLPAALDAARPGDVLRLGPGVHHASLGRRTGPLRIEGAGAEATEVAPPEGEDGLVVLGGEVTLSGLALRSGPARAALKVLGGGAALDGVVLLGGAAGAYVEGGRLDGRDVLLSGEWGLLGRAAQVALTGGSARGGRAGVALLSGSLSLTRFDVTGPAAEAGISVSGETEARLREVVIRAPGPSGLAVGPGAKVEAEGLEVSGALEQGGVLGDCVQVRRGTVHLSGSTLTRCAGAALEASRATLDLRGVNATGGQAGCLVLVDGTTAALDGNRCTGQGPAVVAAGGSRATASMNRWMTDPVLWVECGTGARVKLGPGEQVAEPCRGQSDPLDRAPHP